MSNSKGKTNESDTILRQDSRLPDRIRTMFDSIDKDKSGIVSADELLEAMKSWGYNLGEAQIDAVQLSFGGKSQDIDFDEFKEFLTFFADMRGKFKTYDADGSNAIDKRELAKLLFDLLPFVTAPIVESALSIFDSDGTDQLEFGEVFSLLVGLRDLAKHFPAKTSILKLSAASYHALLRSMSIYAAVAEVDVQLSDRADVQQTGVTLEDLLALMVQFKKHRTAYAKRATEARLKKRETESVSQARKTAVTTHQLATDTDFKGNEIEKKILAQFKSSGKKFEDPDFPATMSSIFPKPNAETESATSALGEWRRPDAIAPKGKAPALFVDGISQGDVMQGSLGDCWFISALAVFAQHGADMLRDMFVSAHPEAGFYQVRLWKNGEWRLVTIDDRLPCSKSGALLFGSCRDTSEFWVALLEKAYAKLHGSYQALVSGKTTDALVDFTGEGSESLEITRSDAFWNMLKSNMSESFLMGCARHAEGTTGEKPTPHGLVYNHAYGILRCEEDKDIRLVCVRNPWGQFEWKGRWSDGSAEWAAHPQLAKKVGYADVDDGTFWMSFDDFCREFNHLYVLRLYSDLTGEVWQKRQENGVFTAETSGGCLNFATWTKNPQFQVSPSQDSKIFVSIVIKDPRSSDGPGNYEAIGAFVARKDKADNYRLTVLKGQQQIAITTTYKTQRECSFEFNAVKGETYVIVPSFFDAGVKSEFYIRVFSKFSLADFKSLTEEQTSVGVSGQWAKGVSSGGCPNYGTWRMNPQFNLEISVPKTQITIALEQTQKDEMPAIGFYLFKTRASEASLPSLDAADKIASTSFSPSPQVSLQVEVTAGTYHVMVSTFQPDLENKFTLKVIGDGAKLSALASKWHTVTHQSAWKPGFNGGCVNNRDTYKQNPLFKLTLTTKTIFYVVLIQQGKVGIGFQLFRNKALTMTAGAPPFAPNPSNAFRFEMEPGEYWVLPSTFNAGENGPFSISVMADKPVEFAPDS